MNSIGDLSNSGVHNAFGLRPVINLIPDITISSGIGTSDNPFNVA